MRLLSGTPLTPLDGAYLDIPICEQRPPLPKGIDMTALKTINDFGRVLRCSLPMSSAPALIGLRFTRPPAYFEARARLVARGLRL